jgi:hypothetical protein
MRQRSTQQLSVKELNRAIGLRHYEVIKDQQRVERSVAIPLILYLTLLKCRLQDIPQRGSWRPFTLKRNFTWEMDAFCQATPV